MNRVRAFQRVGGLCLIAIACTTTDSSSLRLYAQQARTTRDGVFTSAQATRGAALYETRCAACHGARLEGSIGPELAGPGFLGVWGGQPDVDGIGTALATGVRLALDS